MKGFTAIAASVAVGIAATLGALEEPIYSMSTLLASLDNVVNDWTRVRGLAGALELQEGYPPVTRAASTLLYILGNYPHFSEQELTMYTGQFGSMASALERLLDDLSLKASDVRSVGATSIVTNDLKELPPIVGSILEGIYERIASTEPCAKVAAVASLGSSISIALDNIGSVYSDYNLAMDLPQAPMCNNVFTATM